MTAFKPGRLTRRLLGADNSVHSRICVLLLIAVNVALFLAISDRLSDASFSLIRQPTSRTKSPEFVSGCRDITQTEIFHVTECVDTAGHRLIEVARKDRDAFLKSLEGQITEDADMDTYYKQNLGPDAFHMVLEGPELTTPHAQFSRFHRYLFGLNVTTSGSYNVTLLHYATNYDAVREMEENSPRSGTRLLMQSYPVELTAVPESSVATGLCSRTAANSGSFQRIASHPLPRTLKKSAHRMRPYAWTPHCAYDQRFYNHENDTCFRQNRSVLFLGDSQARETYVLLRKRLAGDTMAVPVATRNPRAKYVFGNEEEAHLEIAWMEDDFLDRLRDIEFLDAYDSVVVDVGHACLGIKTEKGGLWKMAFFQQHIRNIFGSLSGYNKQRSRRGLKAMQILFLGIQSIGICEDADPERCPKLGMYAGWRTPDRMRIANQVAREAHASNPTFMEEIQFLDGFDWTSPWILDAFDGLSFVGTPGLSALVDEVLHRLNLCSMGS